MLSFSWQIATAFLIKSFGTHERSVCLPGSTPCSNRDEYLFFDSKHVTEAANCAFAHLCINRTISQEKHGSEETLNDSITVLRWPGGADQVHVLHGLLPPQNFDQKLICEQATAEE